MKNRLLQMLEGKTIAIVGNCIPKQDYSAEIDSADVVVRFNHFYNYDSGKVGKRVDIILQTVASAWFKAAQEGKAHIDVIHEQKPAIFLVKRPDNYSTDTHAVYGKGVRVDNLTHLFLPWWQFTTGTAALCYLATNLKNAKVRCYGFANEGDEEPWQHYIATDARHYAQTAESERIVQKKAIAILHELEIAADPIHEMPKAIVIPVKANSEGAPGKNRILLRPCLEKLQGLNLPIYVVGDDLELLHEVKDLCIPVPLSHIDTYDDVTKTLRKWQVETGFVGDVALVLCTSPSLKPEWVTECFNGMNRAPLAATAVELEFKASAIYREENGVFVPASQALPAASVARQLLPRTVRITGAVEAFHTDAITFDSFWQCGCIEPIIVDDALDVDYVTDLQKAIEQQGIINK